jgi:hypothetical protein
VFTDRLGLLVIVGGTFSSQTGGAVGSQFDKDGAVGGVSTSFTLSLRACHHQPSPTNNSDLCVLFVTSQTAQKASDKVWDAGKAVKGEK